MKKIFLNREMIRTYKNNGQHAEQVFRFTLSGEIFKADNKPATECGDYLDIQIKTAKASVCKGNDLKAYLELDTAKRYAYVTKDFAKDNEYFSYSKFTLGAYEEDNEKSAVGRGGHAGWCARLGCLHRHIAHSCRW